MHELYLYLTTNCNFSCRHCSTSRFTPALVFDNKDLSQLVDLLHSDPQITKIHFFGGEPALCLDIIQKIQKNISTQLSFSLTTNASLDILDKIKLDEIVISFDKYHEPYIDRKKIIEQIQKALDKNIKVIINTVIENFFDFEKVQSLQLPRQVEVRRTLLCDIGDKISSQKMYHEAPSTYCCPSLVNISSNRFYYYPTKGITPCCGPLVFDASADEELVFSKTREDNKLAKIINRPFDEIYTDFKVALDKAQFRHVCEVCVNLFKNKKTSLYALSQINEKTLLPFENFLEKKEVESLHKTKCISYIFSGRVSYSSSIDDLENEKFTVKQGTNLDTINLFFKKTFIEKFDSLLPVNDPIRESFDSDFINQSKCLFFYERENLCGLAILTELNPAPYDNLPSLHISFVGYDSQLVTKASAKSLKLFILQSIEAKNPKCLRYTAVVDAFNESSIKFFQIIGLSPLFLRIRPWVL